MQGVPCSRHSAKMTLPIWKLKAWNLRTCFNFLPLLIPALLSKKWFIPGRRAGAQSKENTSQMKKSAPKAKAKGQATGGGKGGRKSNGKGEGNGKSKPSQNKGSGNGNRKEWQRQRQEVEIPAWMERQCERNMQWRSSMKPSMSESAPYRSMFEELAKLPRGVSPLVLAWLCKMGDLARHLYIDGKFHTPGRLYEVICTHQKHQSSQTETLYDTVVHGKNFTY